MTSTSSSYNPLYSVQLYRNQDGHSGDVHWPVGVVTYGTLGEVISSAKEYVQTRQEYSLAKVYLGTLHYPYTSHICMVHRDHHVITS
jgi:hypothetical protein